MVRELTEQARTHSTWQRLETSDRPTLLIADYGPEILVGVDANGSLQGAGTDFNSNSAVPGDFPDIQGVSQLSGPIEGGSEHKSGPCPRNYSSFF